METPLIPIASLAQKCDPQRVKAKLVLPKRGMSQIWFESRNLFIALCICYKITHDTRYCSQLF